MGLAGVGAASFIGLKSADADDEDTETLEHDELTQESSIDLLHHVHTPEDGAFSAATATTNPSDDIAEGWGDDILNETMQDFEDANEGSVEQPDDTEATVSPLWLDDPIADDTDTGSSTDFSLTDWISERSGSEILDYSSTSESLMLIWDDTQSDADEPKVDVAPDPDDPEVMQVSMNGENVAEVYGDTEMDASDLTLIPLSSAIIIGLAPALANMRPQSRAV